MAKSGANASERSPVSLTAWTRSVMSRKGRSCSVPFSTTWIVPACSTTNSRLGSPGGAVTSTGLSNVPICVSCSERRDVHRGRGRLRRRGGGLADREGPLHAELGVTGDRAEKANAALLRESRPRSSANVPGRGSRVRLFPITKSCGTLPRLRTTNFTVVPAGTERRESLKEKSFASTRIVTGACRGRERTCARRAGDSTSRDDRGPPEATERGSSGRW